MRKLLLLLALFPLSAFAQQINPATQINWPLVTGTAAPTASCTSTNYGQPYLDLSTFAQYLCVSGGWSQISTLFQHNGTNLADQTLLNFNDTIPAAPSGTRNITFQTDASGDLSAYYTPGELSSRVNVTDPQFGAPSGCANAADPSGVKDSTCAIEAAVNKINSLTVPAMLYFPTGIYKVNPILSPSGLIGLTGSNDVIEGDSAELEIAIASTPYNEQFNIPSGTTKYWDYIHASGNNVVVRGMTFNSNGQSNNESQCSGTYGCFATPGIYFAITGGFPNNVKALDNSFLDENGWAVLAQADNVIIRGNYAEDSAGMVCETGASSCNISNNISIDPIDAPYAANGGSTNATAVSNFVISGNIDIGGDTTNGNGIDITAANDGTVIGNYITNASSFCIQVDKTGGIFTDGAAGTYIPSIDINVTGNSCVFDSITHNVWNGLNGGEILIGDPWPDNGTTPYTPGETASQIVVQNNSVFSQSPSGLNVVVGYGADGITVSGNYLIGCGNGGTVTCVPPAVRIEDLGEDSNLSYIDNNEDASNLGYIDINNTTLYSIHGNDMNLKIVSGSPSFYALESQGEPVCLENGDYCPGIANIQVTVAAGTVVPAATGGEISCTVSTATAMPGVLTTSTFNFQPTTTLIGVAGWDTGTVFFQSTPTDNTLNWALCTTSTTAQTLTTATTWNVSAK